MNNDRSRGRLAGLWGVVLACAWTISPAQRTLEVAPAAVNATDPDLTADGRLVSFRSGGQVLLARPDGSGLTPLPVFSMTNQSLSGDGSRLGLAKFESRTQIFDVPTMTLTPELPFFNNNSLVRISANSARVAFNEALQIMVADADGLNVLQVGAGSNEPGGPDITADGGRVVYVDRTCIQTPNCVFSDHVIIVNADGTGTTLLTSTPGADHRRARISDEGATVIYQRSSPTSFGSHLGAVDGDGANERVLTSLLPIYPWFTPCSFGCDSSDLSGDGLTAVFGTRGFPTIKTAGIFTIRTDGTGLRQVGYGGPAVAINGDGSIVAYTVYQPGFTNPMILATGIPGHVPKELDDLNVAANGQTLSWASSPLANSHNLYRADLASLGSGDFGTCVAGSITASSATDATTPAPGSGFAYLVTGENGTGEGTAGFTSAQVERIPAGSCPPADSDGEAIEDALDNCALVPNPSQANADGDSLGDICDNCPTAADESQIDRDSDRVGDACEAGEDLDGDGVLNMFDNCPTVTNPGQQDSDGDGRGNACDNPNRDQDGDGVADASDNCPEAANPGQEDADGDSIGDACDPEDYDGDGVLNFQDNCPTIPNASQTDTDGDGIGDACEAE